MYSKIFALTLFCTALALAQSSYTPLPVQQANAIENAEAGSVAPYSNYVESNGLEGYTVQSGYEGYLVPYEDLEPALALLETKGFIAAGLKLIHTVPKLAIKLLFKAIPHVLFVGAILLVGGALTTCVCSFTSLCSAGFIPHLLHKFDKEQVSRSLGSMVTDDHLNAASHYVKTAVENYYKNAGLIKKSGRSKKL